LAVEKYPRLCDFGLKMQSMFGSTYMHEFVFSSLKQIKSPSRTITALLQCNLLAQLRCNNKNTT